MLFNRHLAVLQGLYQTSWPAFFTRILSTEVLEKLDSERLTDGNHRRAEWTWPLLLVTGLMMGWSRSRSITQRFGEALEAVSTLGGATLNKSYQGFMKQLEAAGGDGLLRRFLHTLRPRLAQWAGAAWTVGPWVPIGVDGTRIDLPRTGAHEQACPRAGRQGSGPQMLVTLLMHLTTGLVWDWRQGPATGSERRDLLDMLAELPLGSLLVGDAGFVGYAFLLALMQQGQPFLIRCGSNVSLLLPQDWPVQWHIERSGQGCRVYLWPKGMQEKGCPPLVLRLIVLRKKGKRPVYLLTNVDCFSLPKAMAGRIYALRWGLEVQYRSLKQTMERRKLVCRTPANAQVELAMNLAALAMLMVHGLVHWGPQIGRMSFAGVLQVLRRAIEHLACRAVCQEFLTRLARVVKDPYPRAGPKSTRRHPQKKKESAPGPPMLSVLTPEQRNLLATMQAIG